MPNETVACDAAFVSVSPTNKKKYIPLRLAVNPLRSCVRRLFFYLNVTLNVLTPTLSRLFVVYLHLSVHDRVLRFLLRKCYAALLRCTLRLSRAIHTRLDRRRSAVRLFHFNGLGTLACKWQIHHNKSFYFSLPCSVHDDLKSAPVPGRRFNYPDAGVIKNLVLGLLLFRLIKSWNPTGEPNGL